MGRLLNNWPYTNIHELNLDWIVKEIKRLVDEWTEYHADWNEWQGDIDEAFKDLKDYVINYFDELDIQEEVNNKLDEMVEQGVLPFLQPKNITPYIYKYGQLLDDWIVANTEQRAGFQSVTFYDNMYFSAGNEIGGDKQYITLWNEQGSILSSNVYTTLGHTNGLAVDDDYIYIADSENSLLHVISRIDYEVKHVLDVSEDLLLRGVSTYEGDVYITGIAPTNYNEGRLYKVNKSFTEYELTTIFEDPDNNVRQDCCIHDGILYLCRMQSNQIIGINIKNGAKAGHYNIPDGDTVFPLGELESCFVKDGVMCIAGAIGTPGRFGYFIGKTQPLCALFKTSIISFIEGRDLTSYGATTLYTNINVNGTNPKRFNPTVSELTTLDEAGSIASYLKSGTILINSITETPQVLYLVDGVYTIRGGNAPKNAYAVFVNSRVRSIAVNFYDTQLQHSILEVDAGYIRNTLELIHSELICRNVNFDLTNFIISGRSPVSLNECFYDSPLPAFTQGTRLSSTIVGRYQQYMFDYLKAFNARYFLTLYTGSYGSLTVVLTMAEIANNSWSKAGHNNEYIKLITCNNGVLTLTLEDDSTEVITAGTLIQLIPCAS